MSDVDDHGTQVVHQMKHLAMVCQSDCLYSVVFWMPSKSLLAAELSDSRPFHPSVICWLLLEPAVS